MRIVEVRVSGRVQGVSFRAWTQEQAHDLGLRGWVRNEPGGEVTACLAGDAARVDQMLERMRSGPPAAEVRDLVVQEAPETKVPEGFEVRR